MKELISYLLQNIQLDFQGDISLDKVRAFLREDDTRDARRLLGKLIDDQSVEPMLITLADCLACSGCVTTAETMLVRSKMDGVWAVQSCAAANSCAWSHR